MLLHPTSLPGPYGIGDLGPEAIAWVDWLAEAGCRIWQVLPLGPTGFANSPYQSLSSFAGNPLLISLSALKDQGLLTEPDLALLASSPADTVDFDHLIKVKEGLLASAAAAAWHKAPAEERRAYSAFVESERAWLDEAALFMALLREFDGRPWVEWPPGLAGREPSALEKARRDLAPELQAETWKQFWFHRQWSAVRQRAAERGVAILGDLPIYAASSSADVWAHPELFRLDREGRPLAVAGVPPDYFSTTGQLWGNPVYDWRRHAEIGYAWWIDRVRAGLRTADILRIDHFRGLEAYWEVPAGLPTAEEGEWIEGPGAALLEALRASLGSLPLLAEDLGFMTPAVGELRRAFDLPGMKILQFAFSGDPEHEFLPHNYPLHCVVYTGTHDNDTVVGWYASAPEAERDYCRRYLGHDGSTSPGT